MEHLLRRHVLRGPTSGITHHRRPCTRLFSALRVTSHGTSGIERTCANTPGKDGRNKRSAAGKTFVRSVLHSKSHVVARLLDYVSHDFRPSETCLVGRRACPL